MFHCCRGVTYQSQPLAGPHGTDGPHHSVTCAVPTRLLEFSCWASVSSTTLFIYVFNLLIAEEQRLILKSVTNPLEFGVKDLEFLLYFISFILSRRFKTFQVIIFQRRILGGKLLLSRKSGPITSYMEPSAEGRPVHRAPVMPRRSLASRRGPVASDWTKMRASLHKTYWQTDMERGREDCLLEPCIVLT